MRLLFAGSAGIAAPSLEALRREHDVVAVLTNPDRPAGRGRHQIETEISTVARAASIPVLKPEHLDGRFRESVRALQPELLVVFAYGHIFGPKFLDLFPRGGINVHPSLLPRHRGPSPIPAAILAGDAETGVTVQRLAIEMDSGDILLQRRLPLTGRETTDGLTEVMGAVGAELVREAVTRILELVPVPQEGSKATYCRLVEKNDGVIDWRLSAVEIDRMVRAYLPWPEAQTTFHDAPLHILEAALVEPAPPGERHEGEPAPPPGRVVGVDTHAGILVQTGHGLLALRKLKLQSKKALNWKDFLNGAHHLIGSNLGERP